MIYLSRALQISDLHRWQWSNGGNTRLFSFDITAIVFNGGRLIFTSGPRKVSIGTDLEVISEYTVRVRTDLEVISKYFQRLSKVTLKVDKWCPGEYFHRPGHPTLTAEQFRLL